MSDDAPLDLCAVFADGPCELDPTGSILDELDATEEIGACVAIVYLRADGGLFVHSFPVGGARLVGAEGLGLEVTQADLEASAHLSVGVGEDGEVLPVLVVEGALTVTDRGIH